MLMTEQVRFSIKTDRAASFSNYRRFCATGPFSNGVIRRIVTRRIVTPGWSISAGSGGPNGS